MTTMTQRDTRPTVGRILQAGAIGVVIAALLNAVLYMFSTAIGALPIMSSMGQPITLVPVLTFTVGSGIVGTILYLILTRFVAHARANRIFVTLASLVLIGMAFTPITSVVAPTMAAVLLLEIMHLVAGLPLMYTLTKMT
ncbi:MAG: hypothetical protein KF832_08185 [Caldilineaceae bacterium]|nr:hypothetical protein [Caldilineaceae bacterium]